VIKDIIYFAKVRPDAKIPSKREEDGGYDIYACFDEEYMILPPHETTLVPTGIASAFHHEYMFLIEERGSSAIKSMKKSAGVIDSGFRKQWFIALYNGNTKPIVITKETNESTLSSLEDDYIIYRYDKGIAQALLLPVPKVKVEEKSYEDLLKFESERNFGMLGSSGK
jgi:dUTP pyrophosphatase